MVRLWLISFSLMTMSVMMIESLHFQHFPIRKGRTEEQEVALTSRDERNLPRNLRIGQLREEGKKQIF